MNKVIKFVAIFLVLGIFLVQANIYCEAGTKRVYAAGWYRNNWKNNVITPLAIETVTGDWIPHTEWGDYDTIIFTQGTSGVEKLTAEQFQEVITWVSAGNSIIFANNSQNSLITSAETYNKPEHAPLTGVSYYNIAKFGPSAIVLDNQHQLTNHMSLGESVADWKDEGYYYAKVTTAQRLVGFNGTGVQQDSGWVFANQIGAGCVYTIIPTPNEESPADFLTLCQKAVLLACGMPLPVAPTDISPIRDNSGKITLSWSPSLVSEGGGAITEYRIYRDNQPNVTLASELVATIEVDETFQPMWEDTTLQSYQERGQQYYYAFMAVDSHSFQSDLSATAAAPALLGTVKGKVVRTEDIASGIQNAEAILIDLETESRQSSFTDALGFYKFDNVIVGEYKLSVRAPLYLVQEIDDLTVTANAIIQEDFRLIKDERESAPPTEFEAIGPDINPGIIELSWKAPLGEPEAYFFKIYRTLDAALLENENYKALEPLKELGSPQQPYPPGSLITLNDSTPITGKTYYYLVTALTGSMVESDPSEIKSAFAVPVGKPEQISPCNGEPVEGSIVTFKWSAISNAKSYILQYADNPEFHNAIKKTIAATQTQFVQSNVIEGKWFWRLAVVLDSDAQSDFSTTYFSTVSADPENVGAAFFTITPEYVMDNDYATLTFVLNQPSVVSLAVYDPNGRLIKRIINKQQLNNGIHSRVWTLMDEKDLGLPNGLYMVCLTMEDTANNVVRVRKGVVLYK